MADKPADDEDDDMFGDFTFVSTPNSNHQTTTEEEDDDDWGDFVTSPKRDLSPNSHQFQFSTTQTFAPPSSYTFEFPDPLGKLSNNISDLEFEFSQNFDPLGVSSNLTTKPIESKPSSNSFEFSQNFDHFVVESKLRRNDSGKNSNSESPKSWEKPKGALPLSIFGAEEKDESDTTVQSLFPSKSLPIIKNGSNMRSTLSFNDIIVNLYGQQAPLNRSISNIGDVDRVENGSKLNAMDDLYGKNEEKKVENGSKLNAIEDLYWTSEHIKVENGSNFNAIEDLFGRNEQIKVETGSKFNAIEDLNGKTEQVKGENGFNLNLIQENEDLDEDEWEFKDAALEKSGKDGDFGVKKDDSVLASWEIQTEVPPQASTKAAMHGAPPKPNKSKFQESAEGSLFGFSNTAQLDDDWFFTPEKKSYSPTVIDNGFHYESGVNTANVWNPESVGQPNHIATANGTNTDLFNGSFGSDESFGDFKDATPTEASNSSSQKKEELNIADQADVEMKEQSVKDEFQGNGKAQENDRGALPLSIFSDGKLISDEHFFDQDMVSLKPITSVRNGINSQLSSSNLSLNDLIKDLYSQAENISAVASTSEHTENGFISPQTGIYSNLADMEDDFDETLWEFKAAFTESKDENLSSVVGHRHTHQKISSESRITSFADFYSRLKEEAGSIILHHLDDLKNAKKDAALSGEDAKVEALHEETQTAYKKLLDENMVPRDDYLKEHAPESVSVNELLAAMEEPNLQVIESEYRLSQRISLAEQSLSSAVWLFEHAISVVKILNLGSGEDISNYFTTWYRMTSVCARELKHGASIWKQSLERNVHKQMLSKPQGKRYILALGEMYRVAEVLRVSATFYKPWILSSLTEPMDIFTPLEECRVVWSNFGINEALQSLSDTVDIGYYGSIKTLLESIKSIRDLDVLSLQNNASPPEETCRLSLLSLKMVPDMKMVLWNGEHYFLTLANLWANLVSHDPPKLPHISVYS